MGQDLSDHRSFQNGCDGFEVFAPAAWAMLHVDGENAGQKFGPADAAGFVGGFRCAGICLGGRLFGNLLFLGHDLGADLGVRGEASEESCQVDPGRRHRVEDLREVPFS